jgi:uncharacterized membrane protein
VLTLVAREEALAARWSAGLEPEHPAGAGGAVKPTGGRVGSGSVEPMTSRPRRAAARRADGMPLDRLRTGARWVLAALLASAGASHLTWGRRGYRIVVPDWATRVTTLDKDAIVVGSGVVELLLAGALVVLPRERVTVGRLVAAFFVAVFPGNVHQWQTGRSAPLMRTDRARFLRLLLQPLLIGWALWSTGPGGTVSRGRAARR